MNEFRLKTVIYFEAATKKPINYRHENYKALWLYRKMHGGNLCRSSLLPTWYYNMYIHVPPFDWSLKLSMLAEIGLRFTVFCLNDAPVCSSKAIFFRYSFFIFISHLPVILKSGLLRAIAKVLFKMCFINSKFCSSRICEPLCARNSLIVR